jgi:hypothetical protein
MKLFEEKPKQEQDLSAYKQLDDALRKEFELNTNDEAIQKMREEDGEEDAQSLINARDEGFEKFRDWNIEQAIEYTGDDGFGEWWSCLD